MDAIENGPFIPTTVINNEEQVNVKGLWKEDDKKKVMFDKKAKNILASTLGIDTFLWISNWKTFKEIWDTLKVIEILFMRGHMLNMMFGQLVQLIKTVRRQYNINNNAMQKIIK